MYFVIGFIFSMWMRWAGVRMLSIEYFLGLIILISVIGYTIYDKGKR